MHGVFQLLLLLLLEVVSKGKADVGGEKNKAASLSLNHTVIGTIGGVVDFTSRMGKEQKVAMEMAVKDICGSGCHKRLRLHVNDSCGSSARTASTSKIIYHYLPKP